MKPTEPIGLLEGLATTRAIRRYTDELIPDDDLATILWHAGRAPSGSNRQPFRFLVLRARTRGNGRQAAPRRGVPRRAGTPKRKNDGYRPSRFADSMQRYVDRFETDAGRRAGLPRPLSRSFAVRRGIGVSRLPEPAPCRAGARLWRGPHHVAPGGRGGATRPSRHP